MIQSVNSNTSLTLDKPFAETTVSNSNYRILLNTAAHFPSDTAAKVERALEQLSDINEAAINNDRTVTAATKVNGKGLSSTMGDIHLNPASVNTNRGGTINFHYNQASSSTSSIYEDASGRIRLDGELNLGGKVTSSLTVDNWIKGTVADNSNGETWRDTLWVTGNSDGARIGMLRSVDGLDYHQIQLTATNTKTSDSSSVWSSIYLRSNPDGTHSEKLGATPATNDNSNQIATTKYVKDNLSSYLPVSVPIASTSYARKSNYLPAVRPITNYNGNTYYDSIIGYIGSDDKILSMIYTPVKFTSSSNWSNSIQLAAYDLTKDNTWATLQVGYNQNGVYTYAPNPNINSNDNNIATTSWVMNRLNTYYKDLGDNYVMNSADFDKCGVLYHIGSLSTATTINYPNGNNNGDWAMLCLRTGNFTTLIGVTPRSTKLFYAKFWSGNFNGWCVFDPVSVSS